MRIGKTLGTDFATGKLTLPLMLLLQQLPAAERDRLAAAVRDGDGGTLAASRRQMRELGVGTAVFGVIEAELAAASGALAPHAAMPPVPLLLQLSALLQSQVSALQPSVAPGGG
jgi:octaprenyl-diphosphate synthase